MNTVRKEISTSFSLILKDKQRETDFYQNYINENLKMPSFDLFFISVFFIVFSIDLFSIMQF